MAMYKRGEVEKFHLVIFDASKPENEWPTGVERLKDWCGDPVYAHNWKRRVQQIRDGDGIEFVRKGSNSFHRIHSARDIKNYRHK